MSFVAKLAQLNLNGFNMLQTKNTITWDAISLTFGNVA